MQRTCTTCGTNFTVSEADEHFYEKMGVPVPTLCPDDMHRARLSFRNEVDLYKRKCDKSGKEILTYYPPHAPQPIFENSVWWSDQWDPMEYGMPVSFERPFFEQFVELERRVPKSNIYVVESENCDYTNYATHNKSCYLIFGSWFSESCLYGQSVYHSLGCIDCHYVEKCQWCYECIDCLECYETAFAQNSQSCTNSWFLFDCRNCENCIGCWNLRRKGYHIWNVPVSKEEFEKTLQKLRTSNEFVELFQEKFRKHVQEDVIHRAMIGENNDNVSGNFIYHSRNVVDSYNVQEAEDIGYSDRTLKQKDQYFCTGVHYGELAFNCLSVDFSHGIVGCMNGEHHTNTAYCIDCYSVEDCFGCVGLRQKKYCILNKQYEKEEYEKLKTKIVEHMRKTPLRSPTGSSEGQAGEWGQYFPVAMNNFYYNRTLANDYFPLSRKEAEKRGYRWKEDEPKAPKGTHLTIPDSIADVPDSITDEVLLCASTQTNYRVTPQELAAYRKMGWPVPRENWQYRYSNRLGLRTPRKQWQRTCANCQKPIQTSYAPDRPEIVHCEQCYMKEVY
ncbi:MAG: hypothetical protein Q7R81_05745 [Candidatus Peregrinibacteria bacterium]|nr:hypothetical protein [Candidatus Peregrinibacteria bacterium]